ncbi:exonuclease [Synechococcales cyanobacterium C]|uniref:Exonuclease n=1 Tax=Petrachloros mirabilis ULC683 TaxID=2781853 RepID=A0A8K2A958_9CYAN|nr:3'-5' exonuclease [Petrachloros mirabilis]NCJ07795.1 exonuclease [Petrachloros mirabilis ULC683]
MSVFVALDFETADRGRDSACAIGLVRVENAQVTHRHQALIRPPRSQFEFTHIHGIRWRDVVNAPTFGQLWPSIGEFIHDAEFIAAHNASFDKGVLYACCDTHQIQRPQHSFLCTVQLARQIWRLRPTKLPNVCAFLGIDLQHHQALSDAEACARIVIAAQSGYRVG